MKETLSLKTLQKLELDLMRDLDRICRKHKLRYSLIYGTMLGAVRHKGFIPWDDDIDVVMPREDYDKLMKLNDEFQSNHELYDHRMRKGYIHPIAKLINTDTVLKEKLNMESVMPLGVYIDIFPADKIPEDKTASEAFQKRCANNEQKRVFSVLRYVKTGNIIKNILKKSVYMYYHRKGPEPYLKQFDKLVDESKSFKSDTYKIMAIPESFPNEISSAEFDHCIEMPFEDCRFYVLDCYDRLLKANYGDYMQLPPVEERVSNHDTIVYWKDGQ